MFRIVLFLSTVLISLPSSADGLTVEEPIEVSEEVEADLYEVPFTVEVQSREEERVLNVLHAVDNAVRLLDVEYDGGKFTLQPVKDKNGSTLFVGRVYYLLKLKNPSDLRKVLETLENLKRNYPEMVFSVGYGRWTVEPSKVKKVKVELKRELFGKVLKEVKNLSETLGAECRVKKVHLSEGTYPFIPFKINIPNPKKGKVKIELRAEVIFECYR